MPTLAAGLAIFLFGHLWYHAKVFGRVWMRLTNITPEMAERGVRQSFFFALVSLVAALVLAAAMRHVGDLMHIHGVVHALFFGAFVWAGFFAPVLLSQVLWEGRSATLYAINGGYWFVALMIAAILLFI